MYDNRRHTRNHPVTINLNKRGYASIGIPTRRNKMVDEHTRQGFLSIVASVEKNAPEREAARYRTRMFHRMFETEYNYINTNYLSEEEIERRWEEFQSSPTYPDGE